MICEKDLVHALVRDTQDVGGVPHREALAIHECVCGIAEGALSVGLHALGVLALVARRGHDAGDLARQLHPLPELCASSCPVVVEPGRQRFPELATCLLERSSPRVHTARLGELGDPDSGLVTMKRSRVGLGHSSSLVNAIQPIRPEARPKVLLDIAERPLRNVTAMVRHHRLAANLAAHDLVRPSLPNDVASLLSQPPQQPPRCHLDTL